MTRAAGMDTDSRALLRPAQDPEPRGDNHVPARATGLSHHSEWKRRWENSAWAPVALKAAGILAGMLTLAGIGAASTLAGNGVPISRGVPQSAAAWIATEPASGQAGHAGERYEIAAPGNSPASAGTGSAPSASVGGAAPQSAGITADGKIVLNAASAEELQKLPRVGAKRAQAIIELRTKLGRFRQTTDLLRVRGIGRKTLRLLTPLLVVDAPNSSPPAGSVQRKSTN